MRSVSNLPEYTTVVGQVFSCGQFYAAATRAGEVAVWRTGDLVSDEPARPLIKFKAAAGLHSLATTERYLLTGGYGEVLAWDWASLARKSASHSWSFSMPAGQLGGEVNAMVLESEGSTAGHLVLGCGDNNLHVVDLETRRTLRTLTGHTGYVHCVASVDRGTLVSGGEEGALKIWDTRSSQPESHTLLPHQEADLARPDRGRFVSGVAASGDLVACVGGPAPSLWQLSSRSLSCRLPSGGDGPEHAVLLLADHVVLGGQGPALHQANLRGEALPEAALSSSCTYSLLAGTHQPNLIVAAGATNRIAVLPQSLDQTYATLHFPL